MAARRKGKAPNTTTAQQYHKAPIVPSSSSSRTFSSTHEYLASRHTSHEPEHVRHYPLDLPSGLPFERYEHRCITTRDILVYRILSKLLFPSTCELAKAWDQRRPTAHNKTKLRHHNFGPLKQRDPRLARDVEVLRKTLTTSISSEWVYELPWEEPPETSSLSVENEVLDLIRIYFMETDDAVTRLWLQSLQLSHRAAYEPLSSLPAKNSTRQRATQGQREFHDRQAKYQYKSWYQEDQEHLKDVRKNKSNTTSMPRLYDGGNFLPRLRLPLLETKALRLRYVSTVSEHHEDGEFEAISHIDRDVFPWPEPPDIPKRQLFAYSFNKSFNDLIPFQFWPNASTVDFSAARVGRGLDRDGVWSTSWWAGDDLGRGRTRRRQRRRATSEPPPGLFMASRLPIRYSFPRELMIFPKMSLATMGRRVRSRSLSRTRIAEMFNWDMVIEKPKSYPLEHPRLTELRSCGTTDYSKVSVEDLDLLLEEYRRQRGIPKSFEDGVKVMWMSKPGMRNALIKCCLGSWLDRPDNHGHPATSTVNQQAQAMHPAAEVEGEDPTLCENCKSTSHATRHCERPCGHCGATNPRKARLFRRRRSPGPRMGDSVQDGNPHIAPDCPVGKQNRCKCVPFPQYHVAAKCAILCSRDCGSIISPGHFKHKSAMTCQSRCCMCGIRGHSGVRCKLRHCRCGGNHLGQDCRFHPECRVPGCDRFLCGMHCQSCGLDRTQLDDGAVLIGQTCSACRGADQRNHISAGCEVVPSTDAAQEEFTETRKQDAGSINAETGKKRRRNRRKHRLVDPRPAGIDEERPWYAPLGPRTRPIVLSKSGKKTDARHHKNGSSYMTIFSPP